MAVVLRFSPAAMGSCRFAVSPLRETAAAVRLLATDRAAGFHEPWLRAVAPALESLDLTPLMLLTPRRTWGADFITPPPTRPVARFATELNQVRRTDPAVVRQEIDRCLTERFGARRPSSARVLAGDGTAARDLCADLLETAWNVLVRPWWKRIRQVLQADVAYRAQALAQSGLAAVLGDLHRNARWSRNALTMEMNLDVERRVGHEGVLLIPGVFNWPGLGVAYDPPSPPTVDYSARGIAAVWQSTPPDPERLGRLIGRRRGVLLAALDEPASTTGLAASCGLPVSSVSEQLAILRDAGLIETWRIGRSLQHARTPIGTALVESGSGPTQD
ncbi:DUF5937 family protein [uncultured Jatrophihabitans sp.]|uniref:ArsR/SmtB family transcription factor n=1 Tax=uncultured Jatrophihabitans sp. TaxID=1610747 RepID=UPI0035CA44A6